MVQTYRRSAEAAHRVDATLQGWQHIRVRRLILCRTGRRYLGRPKVLLDNLWGLSFPWKEGCLITKKSN